VAEGAEVQATHQPRRRPGAFAGPSPAIPVQRVDHALIQQAGVAEDHRHRLEEQRTG
jgi:hypothetical protein